VGLLCFVHLLDVPVGVNFDIGLTERLNHVSAPMRFIICDDQFGQENFEERIITGPLLSMKSETSHWKGPVPLSGGCLDYTSSQPARSANVLYFLLALAMDEKAINSSPIGTLTIP
jgi:hypothetical protein